MSKFLSRKKRYLQIALNNSLREAESIINQLPRSERIIIEAGTPLIKRYGANGIRFIKEKYKTHLLELNQEKQTQINSLKDIFKLFSSQAQKDLFVNQEENEKQTLYPYVVADLKTMDRGKTEVLIASYEGADAVTASGHAPIETLNSFIQNCKELGLDSMIDMMNVENPVIVLKTLKRPPDVVILHRGVDETEFNKDKQLPLHEIRRIKGSMNVLIAVAGGDSIREVQRAIFNDADIVIVWKEFYHSTEKTSELAKEFLRQIK
jgi:bifunctional enzyme Fae/Hps